MKFTNWPYEVEGREWVIQKVKLIGCRIKKVIYCNFLYSEMILDRVDLWRVLSEWFLLVSVPVRWGGGGHSVVRVRSGAPCALKYVEHEFPLARSMPQASGSYAISLFYIMPRGDFPCS